MKKIIVFMILFSSLIYSQGRTSNYSLPLWNAGNTLTAGSTTDTSTSNAGINSISLRTDKFFNQYFSRLNDSLRGIKYIRASNGNRFDFNAASGTYLYTDYLYITPSSSASVKLWPYGTSAGNTAELVFTELSANGVNHVGFKARDTLAGNVLWKLPNADGTSGQVLATNGSSLLYWTSAAGGAVDSGNFAKLTTANTFTADQNYTQDGSTDLTLTSYHGTNFPQIKFQRGKGSQATPLAVGTGTELGYMQFSGYGATGFISGGSLISAEATQTWTDANAGSNIVFRTTPNNSTTRTTALTLGQDQSATFTGTVTMPTPFTLGATSVTSSGAELNVLDGVPATLTATELGYVDGVTSAIQTQIDAKAPLGSPTFTTGITTPVATVNGTSGNTLVVETSGLVYDATNNRVGINVVSPTQALDIASATDGDVQMNLRQYGDNRSALMSFRSNGLSPSGSNPDWAMGIIYNTNHFSFGTWDGTTTRFRMQIDTAGNTQIGNITSYNFGDVAAKSNLFLYNGTAGTTTIADVSRLWSQDAAAGQANLYAMNEAKTITRLTGNHVVTTAQFDKTTNTTLADVTGLTLYVEAGKTYSFEAGLFVDADATGGHKYAISGTATATSIKYQINSINNSTNAFVINSRQSSLGGSAGQASATTVWTEIKGTIVVNAAGTLTVQFAQNASSGTSSVLTQSYFRVKQ